MESLTVKTNLHCDACVDKITPVLNEDRNIKEWQVDTEHGSKFLTVKGEDISKDKVQRLLDQAGYSIVDEQDLTKDKFWGDKKKWKRASFNTLNCLIGCSIGDFGMVFYLQAFHPQTPLMMQMTLAIIAGLCTSILLETIILKTRESFGWLLAFKTAFGMSFISMVAMELAMTSTDFMITGGEAAFNEVWYWLALIPALVVGFLTPLPYNYYRLKKFDQACH